MSSEALTVVNHHSHATGPAKVVLLALAYMHDSPAAMPTTKILAEKTGLTRRSVQRAIGNLEATGEIRRHYQGHGPSSYEIRVRCPYTCGQHLRPVSSLTRYVAPTPKD